MTHRYIPAHTLRTVLMLCVMPEARFQIPVALASPAPSHGGAIVMLERPSK